MIKSQRAAAKSTTYNHYLIISAESVLINNTIEEIKKSLNVDENFDVEICSITEQEYSDIINKIYTAPFVSPKRVVVLKNIEREDLNRLREFARLLPAVPPSCCLIMVYKIEDKQSKKRNLENFKKVCEIFPQAHSVTLIPDEATVYHWILKKLHNMGLKDRPELVAYLMEEFTDDLTGLKNELQKIENYLFQMQEIDIRRMKELAPGLTDDNIYLIANKFFQSNPEALKDFVRAEVYLRTSLPMIGLLARMLCDYATRYRNDMWIRRLGTELAYLDNRAKRGSEFLELNMEIFFIKNLGINQRSKS
ncbi:MAG: DNA polymerase III subunit delta [candidate division WOR-3 bacterium]